MPSMQDPARLSAGARGGRLGSVELTVPGNEPMRKANALRELLTDFNAGAERQSATEESKNTWED
jgi:hypothetical protein